MSEGAAAGENVVIDATETTPEPINTQMDTESVANEVEIETVNDEAEKEGEDEQEVTGDEETEQDLGDKEQDVVEQDLLDDEVAVEDEAEPIHDLECEEVEESEEQTLSQKLGDPEVTTDKLRDLLMMEDFAAALQNGDDEVLTFLECPNTIKTLMLLLLSEPFDPENMNHQRVIHIVVQTLVSGIITDVFIMHNELLQTLFDHLEELDLESPGAAVRSGCVAKILISLFEKFTTPMITNFQNRENFIPSLLLNVNNQNLMEILNKLVESELTHAWLHEAQLITRLIVFLHRDETLETQETVANVLYSILSLCQTRSGDSILVEDLLNNDLITGSIINYMEAEPHSGEAVKFGLCVLIGILGLISDDLEDPPVVVNLLTGSIGFFNQILVNPGEMDNSESFSTTTGHITRGFGFVRMSVLEFLISLLYTGFPNVVEYMSEEKVFTVVLDLLFEFKWNNIIHYQISQLFSGLFCCTNAGIIIDVLMDCRLPSRIAEAHANAESEPVGFLGHLRELANELVRLSKNSEPVSVYLMEEKTWMDFVAGELKEHNMIECVVQDDYTDEYENQFFDQLDEYGSLDGEILSSTYEEYGSEEYGSEEYGSEEYGEEEEEEAEAETEPEPEPELPVESS